MPETAATTAAIPTDAWIQAVFVCLFIVYTLGLAWWFSRQQAELSKWMSDETQKNRDWMDAKEARADEISRRRECQTAEQMDKVADALDRIVQKLEEHDEKVEARVATALKAVNRRRE